MIDEPYDPELDAWLQDMAQPEGSEDRMLAEERGDPRTREETLGACGCTDYHMADCSSGGAWLAPDDYDEGGDDR